jgi:heme-degrading monooxygenase HmoA
MTDHHLAQFNVGRLRAPLDAPSMAEFLALFEPVNALADTAPGFVWRLTDGEGDDAIAIRPYGDHVIINLSVWESREALWNFAYRSTHLDALRRRREWFTRMVEPYLVMWWVPAGRTPSVEEALDRLERIRRDGPGPGAFTFRQAYDTAGAILSS